MKRPGFLDGVVVAAVLAFFASAVVAVFIPFVGVGAVSRLLIPALGFAYLLYRQYPGWPDRLRFAAGGAPVLALFLFYHQVAFGGPLTLPGEFLNPIHVSPGAHLGVFRKPSSKVIFELLFGPTRGLLMISPFLALGLLGILIFFLSIRHRSRGLACLFGLIFVVAAFTKQNMIAAAVATFATALFVDRRQAFAALAVSVPVGAAVFELHPRVRPPIRGHVVDRAPAAGRGATGWRRNVLQGPHADRAQGRAGAAQGSPRRSRADGRKSCPRNSQP